MLIYKQLFKNNFFYFFIVQHTLIDSVFKNMDSKKRKICYCPYERKTLFFSNHITLRRRKPYRLPSSIMRSAFFRMSINICVAGLIRFNLLR